MQPVLIDGRWRESQGSAGFRPVNPNTGMPLEEEFPISPWADVEAALDAGLRAAHELRSVSSDSIAAFLDAYADEMDAHLDRIVQLAHEETGLPVSPRLEAEVPRTSGQLRQAAAAARDGSWATPTIDTESNIRSMYESLDKPVVVFGPNNFPVAFNGISGGDFAAAVAAGNPVVVKANPGHPRTTQYLAEAAVRAMAATDVPDALVQLIYHMDNEDGLTLVSDRRVGAVAFTGSKRGGLALKKAADEAGIPIYLEMGSVNPVFVLEGAVTNRGDEIAEEFYASCTLGAGQYCTNPGLVVVPTTEAGDRFVKRATELFDMAEPGTLLGSPAPVKEGVSKLAGAGAHVLIGGDVVDGGRYAFHNTLLTVTAAEFLDDAETLQAEVFGPVSLLIRADSPEEMAAVAVALEGNLTGGIYSEDTDDQAYRVIEQELRPRVGRLLNDKMPTGVAVVPSMNHGGPYPATGHPGFTAVGIPASIHRFAALRCYDNVPQRRLPHALRDANPTGSTWRLVDGSWTKADIA